MSTHNNIVCLKWGNKYGAEYVNRLYSMVNRHCTVPFNFYCITDDPTGIKPEIKIKDFVDHGVIGWWNKLTLFKDDCYGINGNIIFLDLDVVIVDNIDNLFSYKPGSFRIIKDLKSGFNSSVFRFESGSLTQVWEEFNRDKNDIVNRLHGDQDWIAECIPEHMNTWDPEWVVSYKKQCNSRAPKSYGRIGAFLRKKGFLKPPSGYAVIPKNSKIVIFHGKPDPEDVAYGPYDMWKQAPWILDAWRD